MIYKIAEYLLCIIFISKVMKYIQMINHIKKHFLKHKSVKACQLILPRKIKTSLQWCKGISD